VSLIHVGSIALGLETIVYPTKLLLMPVLAIAALWALWTPRRAPGADRSVPPRAWRTGAPEEPSETAAATLLFLAIAFSWLGDGASFFFPMFDDELPAMLLCFGVAHVVYIWLLARHLGVRRIPAWTVVYAAWWGILVAVLWPHLGSLLVPVMIYGVVLGGTALASTRGGTITALGGAFFLASDTILALRLFMPGVSAELTGPWVMLTYTLGQGLLVWGIVRVLQERRA
jgi:uncharacterized membrane protein YhhN